MKITIGSEVVEAVRPDDLGEQLAEASGLSFAETAAQLAGDPSAGVIARALRPFLGSGAPPVAALATSIREAGLADVLRQVRRLFAAKSRRARKDGNGNGK